MVVEVTEVSWFSRIKQAFVGIFVGLAFFVGAFPLLWWNEGRAVKTQKSLEEGQGAVITVPADRVNPANNMKLVHLTGRADTSETMTDPQFLVSAPNAIKLRRNVEMYQWEENKETKTRKKLGGGEERVTTYTYDKKWSDRLIDSSNFKEAEDHHNPSAMPFESREAQAEHVTVGAFSLTRSLVDKLNEFEPVSLTPEHLAALPDDLKSKLKVANNSFYAGEDPQNAQIGDARITFSVVKPADVTVVSKQSGTTFEPYRASAGMDIEMLKRGVFTAQAMFESALRENTILTWILRAVGFFLMFIGLAMFFRPISVVGDVVPMFGSLLAFGTGLFAFIVAGVLSIGTIGVAWIVYRPVLGITLLSAAIALLVWFALRGRKRVAAAAMAGTATATT